MGCYYPRQKSQVKHVAQTSSPCFFVQPGRSHQLSGRPRRVYIFTDRTRGMRVRRRGHVTRQCGPIACTSRAHVSMTVHCRATTVFITGRSVTSKILRSTWGMTSTGRRSRLVQALKRLSETSQM